MTERVCAKCGGAPRMVQVYPLYWRKECSACGSTGPFAPVCGFCKNQPVANAASWLDGKERPPAPCPRCGKTYARLAEALPEGSVGDTKP